MDTRGDAFEAGRAVPRRVETGDVGEQHLRRADVGRGPLAPDVLLAGLECQPQCRPARGVGADPDEAAGKCPRRVRMGGDESRVRPAERHRHPEALRRTDHDVGAELPGRRREHAGQQIGGDDRQAAGGMDRLDRRRPVGDRTSRGREAEEGAEPRPFGQRVDVTDDELDADRFGPRRQHRDRLRVRVVVDEEAIAGTTGQPTRHRHRLGRRGRLVEQRSVGDLEPGELGDHRLEVEQRLEPALADLGLVRRVRRVPRRVLEHVAGDHGRHDRVRVAHPDQAREHPVLAGELAELGDHVALAHRPGELERRRHRGSKPGRPDRSARPTTPPRSSPASPRPATATARCGGRRTRRRSRRDPSRRIRSNWSAVLMGLPPMRTRSAP